MKIYIENSSRDKMAKDEVLPNTVYAFIVASVLLVYMGFFWV